MWLRAVLALAALVAAAAQDLESCKQDPTTPDCSSYVYPADLIASDIEENCFQMPWMVGCGLWNACQAGDMGDENPYCEPFSALATQCTDKDMQGMVGCQAYTALCANQSSVVPQCTEHPPLPGAVHTDPSQTSIIAECSTHNMPGCETCTGKFTNCADTLLSLSMVCHAHRMESCEPFWRMCSSAGEHMDHFCSNEGKDYDPPMRMYFHGGITDIILWRTWVPETGAGYSVAILVCVLTGIVAHSLRAFRTISEAKERVALGQALRNDPEQFADQKLLIIPRSQLLGQFGRATLSFIIIVLDYALMLAAMTFNTGIFIGVCLGLALGYFFFSQVPMRFTQRLQARQMGHSGKLPNSEGSSGKVKATYGNHTYHSVENDIASGEASKTEGECCGA